MTETIMNAAPRTCVALSLTLSALSHAEPASYELDPEHLAIAFKVHHLEYADVLGFFEEGVGSFTFDEATGELGDVRVTVGTGSVYTSHEARDEHLISDDFLDTRAHRAMTFTAQNARRTGERTFEIPGELELLGQRRPLTLSATWNKSAEYPIGDRAHVIGVSATGTVKRSEFGMSYGVDNGWVGDEVEIIVEFEARRRR
jgi:polyisoprenoid-binding protein YceI